MLDFRPPSFVRPQEYPDFTESFGKSLDTIFNAYLLSQQQKRQNVQDLLNYGLPLSGVTDKQIAAAQRPAQSQEEPGVVALRNLIQQHVQQRGLGLQKSQAELNEIGARTEKEQAQAGKFRSELGSDFYTPEQAASLIATPGNSKSLMATKSNLALMFPDNRIPKDYTHTAASILRSSLNIGEKEDQFQQKRLTLLGEALDPSKQRAGAFSVSKAVFDRAERLQSLAHAFPSGQLRRQEIEEIAIGLNAMLSGANLGAQEQVRSLMPNTIVGNVAKMAEWLGNNPTGANQAEIVDRMLGSVSREKATAAAQMKRTQLERTTRFSDLEKKNPDGFYNTLLAYGIEPQEYLDWKARGFKPASAVQGNAATPDLTTIETRTLKDGTRVNVRRLPNGTYEEVP